MLFSGADEESVEPRLIGLRPTITPWRLRRGGKSHDLSAGHPERLVLGADQLLVMGDRRFDKPRDRGQAAAHLAAFSGRAHELVTAAVALRGGDVLWRRVDRARIHVRPLSSATIGAYLDAVGPAALTSVGAYQFEGRGAQLFERVAGDFFTVLGLPLLPLLEFLRSEGVPEWAC